MRNPWQHLPDYHQPTTHVSPPVATGVVVDHIEATRHIVELLYRLHCGECIRLEQICRDDAAMASYVIARLMSRPLVSCEDIGDGRLCLLWLGSVDEC